MTRVTVAGVVRGRTIELAQEPGIPDGQAVTVIVQAGGGAASALPPGEGLRRSAGTWADDPEGLEEYLAWTRGQRKAARREIKP